jgi:hypothetical protein
MAGISSQGSRAGLITALVILVIGFFTATIYAIYFDAQWEKAKTDAAQEHATRVQYVSDAELTSPDIQKYVTAAKKPQAALDVAIAERELLAKDIVGTPKTAATTADTAAAIALKYANDQLAGANIKNVSVSQDLATTIRTLSTAIVTLDAERTKAEGDAKAAADAAQKTTEGINALLKAKDDEIAKVTADKDAATAASDSYRKDKDGDIAKLGTETDQKLKDTQAAADKLQTEISKRDATVKQLTTMVAKLEGRLRATHVNTNEPVVQQSDGYILRTPTQNTVFINIGQQDSVSLGLTFEVYDKDKGIPALGDGLRDGDLPEGKASIEVIHVLPTSSECRVVKRALGETITEGDLIMNLVFDPHTHYKFLVYGNFDMSNEGTPTSTDTDVIKRLVTQWGGRLVTKVDPSTDFVVLGSEPVVPVLSADDQNDPPKVQQRDAMQAALDAYQEVEKQAIELGIPILNQNRFLYFTGYYDQAAR